MEPLFVALGAHISNDLRHRYALWRHLGGDGHGPVILFVLFNPSVADWSIDDPTIRRCLGFAKREAAQWMRVVNLYGIRSRDPKAVWLMTDPVGPDNDAVIARELDSLARLGGTLIFGWGALTGPQHEQRVAAVMELCNSRNIQPMCLGINRDLSPKHPLYVRKDAPLVPWQPPTVLDAPLPKRRRRH